MSKALHLAATLRNLGARDASLLRCVDVVAYAGNAIEVIARCQPSTDGAHRAVLQLDPRRHSALALRLHFHDGRSRLCQATPLCACRCHGLAVVHFDAMDGCGRWCFGPDDDMRSVHSGAMEPHWHDEAKKSQITAPPQLPKPGKAVLPDWLLTPQSGATAQTQPATSASAGGGEEKPAQAKTISAADRPTPVSTLADFGAGGGETPAQVKSFSIADRPAHTATLAEPGTGGGASAGTMRANKQLGGSTVLTQAADAGKGGNGGDKGGTSEAISDRVGTAANGKLSVVRSASPEVGQANGGAGTVQSMVVAPTSAAAKPTIGSAPVALKPASSLPPTPAAPNSSSRVTAEPARATIDPRAQPPRQPASTPQRVLR